MISEYLSMSDFTARIGGIPSTFQLERLAPFWIQETETIQFVALLPSSHSFWVLPVLPSTSIMRLAFKKYMVYAIWSRYIGQGHVIITDTGPVAKDTENSTKLTNEERNYLVRYYEALALPAWDELTNSVNVPELCKSESFNASKLSVISARAKSNF